MRASLANQSLSLLAFNCFDLSLAELEVLLRSQQYDRYGSVHLIFVDGVEPLLDIVKGLLRRDTVTEQDAVGVLCICLGIPEPGRVPRYVENRDVEVVLLDGHLERRL